MRKNEATTSAIRKLRAPLSALFATAVEDGLIRSSPVSGVRIPGGGGESEDKRPKALTRTELRLLLAALPDDRSRLFFELLAMTGLRIGEAIGLTWGNLDLGGLPQVRVRGQIHDGKRKQLLKSREGRRDVPLSPGMRERLLVHRRDNYGGEDAPVFTTRVGTPLIPGHVRRRVLHPAAKSVGLVVERDGKMVSWVTPHTFRHTCASLLFAEGRNVKQVQVWLGHAEPTITLNTYTHLMDSGVGDAAFMDDALRPEGGNRVATEEPETAVSQETVEALGTG
jgi:integrase